MPDTRKTEGGSRSSRMIIGVLILVIALGIGIWSGLMMGGLRELRAVSALRSDPLDLLYLTDQVTASESQYMLLGDSRVAQWKPLPEIDSSAFTSVGSSGMTAIQMELAIRLLATRFEGKTVVIQIGINDLKSIGYMDRSSEEIISETKRALAAIHRTLAKSGAKVYISTIIPPGPITLARRPIWSERIRDAVVSVNEALVSGHLMPVSAVINFSDSLGTLHATDAKFCTDSLHLNAEGYDVLDLILVERVSGRGQGNDALQFD